MKFLDILLHKILVNCSLTQFYIDTWPSSILKDRVFAGRIKKNILILKSGITLKTLFLQKNQKGKKIVRIKPDSCVASTSKGT